MTTAATHNTLTSRISVLSLVTIGVVAALIAAWLLPYRTTTPAVTHDPTTVRICAAFHSLRQLSPDRPSSAPTPLQLLQLDPSTISAFHGGKDAAIPGSKAWEAAKDEVLRAGMRVRATLQGGGDGGGAAVTDKVARASWFVTEMLLHDETRVTFLRDVQPRLSSWHSAVKTIEGLCHDVWEDQGWNL